MHLGKLGPTQFPLEESVFLGALLCGSNGLNFLKPSSQTAKSLIACSKEIGVLRQNLEVIPMFQNKVNEVSHPMLVLDHQDLKDPAQTDRRAATMSIRFSRPDRLVSS